ncbi:hypothetical protein N2152v2_004277 [Parachlorella kessleri]
MSQVKKAKSFRFRLTVTLIHLAFWAELGGIYFKDLPANLLGSFVIGVFVASSTVGLKNEKALAVLPKRHSWQDNLELQIGIRTGYCGSLTTFASWQLELMTAAIDSNQWMNMVVGFLIGLYGAIVSYILGTHVALFVDRWLLPEHEDVLKAGLEYRVGEVEALGGAELTPEYREAQRPKSPEEEAQEELEEWEPDLPTNRPSISRASLRRRLVVAGVPERELSRMLSRPPAPAYGLGGLEEEQQPVEAGQPQPGRVELGALSAGTSQQLQYGAQVIVEEGNGYGGSPAASHAGSADGQPQHADGVANGGAKAAPEQELKQQPTLPVNQPPKGQASLASPSKQQAAPSQQLTGSELQTFMGNKTDCAALLGLLGMTAALAVGTALETGHTWLRQIWIAILFGPLGCTLRWWLSRYNYKLHGSWSWFPIGTFVANMLATAIDFGLQCVFQRRSNLSYAGHLLLPAVMTGFSGSLSTVSTFVTEVVKFADLFPETIHTYAYTVYSLVGGALLGIGIYGWSVWAPF